MFAKAGGREVLQASLGLSKQSMSDWVRWGVVPVKHCPAVHVLTGIPMAQLNPELDLKAVKAKVKADKKARG